MLTRRLLVGAGLALALPRPGRAAALEIPVVDRLELTILADGAVSSFATPVEQPGLRIMPAPRPSGSYRNTLRAEWGYSVMADAFLADTRHRLLIDFGYTPEALASNMAILGVDPSTFEAMVLSHGHYDHFGGMPAVLGRVKRGTPLYVGGEEAFCGRLRGTSAEAPSFGQIDRADIRAAGIDLRIMSESQLIAGAAFTTGRIPLISPERPRVPTAMLPGQGCARAQLDPDRRDLDVFVDDAVHELGTAFNLRGKGLVVIGSLQPSRHHQHRACRQGCVRRRSRPCDHGRLPSGSAPDASPGAGNPGAHARSEPGFHFAGSLHGRSLHRAGDR